MSNLKYDAIIKSGITVGKRYEIPDELIPADSRVEIDAKVSFTELELEMELEQEQQEGRKGRMGRRRWMKRGNGGEWGSMFGVNMT